MYRFDPKETRRTINFRAGGDLYRLMTEDKRQLLIENTARNIAPVTDQYKIPTRFIVSWLIRNTESG
jgi:catalase